MCLRPGRLGVVLGLLRAPPGLASTDGQPFAGPDVNRPGDVPSCSPRPGVRATIRCLVIYLIP
jgi:hypothetical protein